MHSAPFSLRYPLAVLVLLTLGCSSASSSSGPSAETLKQVLTAKLLKLKPSGMTERQVVYQNVRAGSDGNFKVTAQIRDYGPGYPRNRYYGETCVGLFDDQTFTLVPDGFGGWDVQGALTPSMEKRTCKPNPSAGATSIPLSSLSGTQASSGTPAPPAAKPASPSGSGAVRAGNYECWANGAARMMLNFSILDGSHYKDSNGQRGTYSVDGKSHINFHGGLLDGAMPAGFTAIYYVPQGRPTVSYRSARGAEASFCQWVR